MGANCADGKRNPAHLLEQPVEDVTVLNALVVAEPDGIQGELRDVGESSICEIPVEQRIVICC